MVDETNAPMKALFDPPHPEFAPVRNEPLRLLMAEQEADYIRKRQKRAKIWIAAAAVIGLVAGAVPIVLFWHKAYWLNWFLDYSTVAGTAAMAGMLLGLFAPLWAMVRIGFEIADLRRYRAYEAEHREFLARYNRCPLDARPKSMPIRRTG